MDKLLAYLCRPWKTETNCPKTWYLVYKNNVLFRIQWYDAFTASTVKQLSVVKMVITMTLRPYIDQKIDPNMDETLHRTHLSNRRSWSPLNVIHSGAPVDAVHKSGCIGTLKTGRIQGIHWGIDHCAVVLVAHGTGWQGLQYVQSFDTHKSKWTYLYNVKCSAMVLPWCNGEDTWKIRSPLGERSEEKEAWWGRERSSSSVSSCWGL